MEIEYEMSTPEKIFYIVAVIAFTVAVFVIVSQLFGARFVERDIGLDFIPHNALGMTMTNNEKQYYCLTRDASQRPPFCFNENETSLLNTTYGDKIE